MQGSIAFRLRFLSWDTQHGTWPIRRIELERHWSLHVPHMKHFPAGARSRERINQKVMVMPRVRERILMGP
jgi:hypothetical protein